MYKEIESLYKRAKKGDVKAKVDLLTRLTPLVISSIKRNYNNQREYEDLIQEGYEVILKAIEEYDQNRGVQLLGYIKAMLRYHYLNKHRDKAILSLNKPLEEGEIMDLIVAEEEPIDTVLKKEETMLLLKALNSLTPRQKKVIVDFYVKNIPIAEIAKNMGISYRTVVNTKISALRKLKRQIVKE